MKNRVQVPVFLGPNCALGRPRALPASPGLRARPAAQAGGGGSGWVSERWLWAGGGAGGR